MKGINYRGGKVIRLLVLFCLFFFCFGQTQEEMIFGGVPVTDRSTLENYVTLTYNNNNDQGFCGSAVIAHYEGSTYLLTAAHCINWDYFERFGVIARYLSVDYRVADIVMHEDYVYGMSEETGIGWRNDIAIVRTESTLRDELGNPAQISVIANNWLLNTAIMYPMSITIGFGLTETGSQPDQLTQMSAINVLDFVDCAAAMPYFANVTILESQICGVGGVASSGVVKTLCSGDSGSSMLVKVTLPNGVGNGIIGISSWRMKCGTPYPDVYTNVPYYTCWVYSQIPTISVYNTSSEELKRLCRGT